MGAASMSHGTVIGGRNGNDALSDMAGALGEANDDRVPGVQGQGLHDNRDQRGSHTLRPGLAGDRTGDVLQDKTVLAMPRGENGEGGAMSELMVQENNLPTMPEPAEG